MDLLIDRSPPVLTVTIARGKANAIDAATSREMSNLFSSFRDDPDYRVAIVTGSGDRFFSAGWDLTQAAQGEEFEADYGAGGFGGFPELPGLRKPIICAVNGMAVGGGFEMVLAAHLVVAAEDAEFFLPEARVGIIPDSALIRLPRSLPSQLANELLLGIRRLTAAEAHKFGLVNRVVPGSELIDTARALAEEVLAAAPLAVEAILDLRERTESLSVKDGYELMRSGGVESYEQMLSSADAAEGPQAFLEKRPPRWQGK
jgi:crotonobetainyl-CoA hydratase